MTSFETSFKQKPFHTENAMKSYEILIASNLYSMTGRSQTLTTVSIVTGNHYSSLIWFPPSSRIAAATGRSSPLSILKVAIVFVGSVFSKWIPFARNSR